MEWKTKFEERIAILEAKIRKLGRELDDAAAKGTALTKIIDDTIQEIAKLQAEAEVNELIHKLPILTSGFAMCYCNFVTILNFRFTCL